ncbi:agmatine deiminase family protein [Chondrinema litorale]|uniref:agmatine deiminase family protein n=1 Tax=Chondrinema litorale TaxID=2994555 RepID=UPI002542E793|nr:agmatine deiminase family protein [Chondrinema litorale]UZR95984.1 agmatine deiminase family protein [Chondrinema litorale]
MQDSIYRLPAEWEEQDAVQISWPHSKEIWEDDHEEVVNLFVSISKVMISYTKLIIICLEQSEVEKYFNKDEKLNIYFFEIPSNDIWNRDHGLLTVYENDKPILLNFIFNGWGQKFASNFDNQINPELINKGLFKKEIDYRNIPFVFEGGSIDSDGKGYALTTSSCIFSKNRNEFVPKEELINNIKQSLGLEKLTVLNHGFLAGDDTDSHVDMLARFVKKDTIFYAACSDQNDEHFTELQLLKQELETLRDAEGKAYNLIPLEIGKVFNDDGKRLPASYVNFLIINNAVLVPQYNVPQDAEAIEKFKTIYTERDVVGVDCSLLIKQGGSLHCATMNFYKGTL